jgi:hypothetical protein
MRALVLEALGRPCACMAGGAAGNHCPAGGHWHTWRQHFNGGFHARRATCFVGTDHGGQAGILKVRFADAATAANEVLTAENAGFVANVEDEHRVRIVTNGNGLLPGTRLVLIGLIQGGVGAFAES